MRDEVALRRQIKCARSAEGHDMEEEDGEEVCQKCGLVVVKAKNELEN